ncbi:glutathione-dependent formaldehyde-activating enzyme, partial [Rhizobium azibense]
MANIGIHPHLDRGLKKGVATFAGGTLVCECTTNPVKVKIKGDIAHNHACGCTKCWKPSGAAFSIVAVAPSESVAVIENGDKLVVADGVDAPRRPRNVTVCGGCSCEENGYERDRH